VKSYPGSFKVIEGLSPMLSKEVKLFKNEDQVGSMTDLAPGYKCVTFNTIFYGRGRGIHSTEPFTGLMIKDLLSPMYPLTRKALQKSIICIAAVDGYRIAVSFSELFNRNDQQEFLLVKTVPGEDGGLFRVFTAADFFSDRAVKSVSEIHLIF
jgi:hypothetical protein